MGLRFSNTNNLYATFTANNFDTDAQAFISAAGITSALQQKAINTLTTSLKGYGLWTKMKAVYPMIGGTATTHKFNLKDPRDLDAAFRLSFQGGWTHSSTGAKPDGINGYADTFLSPFTHVNSTNHLSYYSRTQSVAGTRVEIGIWDASPNTFNQLRVASNYYAGGLSGGGASFTTTADGRGFWLGTKRASNDRELYLNGTSQATSTTNDTFNLPNNTLYLGARRQINHGGPATEFYTDKECAFSSIGDGLTDTEASNFYTAVQAFNTTLGRQV